MRSIIIFGGTKGIGKKLAEHYNKNSFSVSVVSRHPEAQDLQEGINVIKANVVNESDVEAAFGAHSRKWGTDAYVVINCAAIQSPVGASWTVSAKEFEETLKINLLGSFLVSQAAVKRMIKLGKGRIIMFSGGGSANARPYFNAYGVSKTGVLRMVENFAQELAQAGHTDITINALAPGAVKTAMTEEVLKAGLKAGDKELKDAADTFRTGGTALKQITDLVDFLIDPKICQGLTGRLIHVREDYHGLVKKYGKDIPEEIGKIRRVSIKS